ncbi:MAG: DUF92 domain-containing protein [Acidobacteria bacterium]|nr:DUF92 domain-containing protein [Acidobacteriota bacterium]
MTTHSENTRQWVHVGSGSFALLLRFLTWKQAAALATVAFLFNLVVLPRIGGRALYRPADRSRGFPLGILVYPLSVLALVLIFPSRLDIVAATWGVLACGDGAATLVGRRLKRSNADIRRSLPWNPDKTVAGTVAFVVCGACGAVALAWWTRPSMAPLPSLTFTFAAPVAAAIAAALVETIPVRLDDNLSVPATAGAVLWLAGAMTSSSVAMSREIVGAALPWALGINGVMSWLGYRANTVSRSGAVGGALVGVIVFAGAGGRAWLLLFITFLAASIASRLGVKRKALLGITEERGGRRGAGNAVANCGVAAIAAIAAVTTPHAARAQLALVAGLVAGASDTVASEIGKAWGRSTWLVTSFGRVRPGTSGAISVEGTVAGLVAAFGLTAIAIALGLVPFSVTLAIVAGATSGAIVESVLGATLEGPGILNNDMLNFINTAIAAAVAIAIA